MVIVELGPRCNDRCVFCARTWERGATAPVSARAMGAGVVRLRAVKRVGHDARAKLMSRPELARPSVFGEEGG